MSMEIGVLVEIFSWGDNVNHIAHMMWYIKVYNLFS
jgi:hypothetical protein